MARPRKPNVLSSLVQTEVSLPTKDSSQTKIEPKPVHVVQLVGVGKNAEGQIGVYAMNYDVANNAAVDYQFFPETGQTEAVERFKIISSNLFMSF